MNMSEMRKEREREILSVLGLDLGPTIKGSGFNPNIRAGYTFPCLAHTISVYVFLW